MLVQGNQQVTTIGWFTGILEGEGTWNSRSKDLKISNTDLGIIMGCEAFLTQQEIRFETTPHNRKGQKPDWDVRISNRYDGEPQYADLLFQLLSKKLECRFLDNVGSSTTTRDPSIDLDWLTGIYEAEGSFSLTFDNRDNAQFGITIPNTNELIINKIIENLKACGCSWYVYDKKPRKDHHKPGWIVSINGMKRCQRFLRVMDGKWISNRNVRRAALMSEFITSRLTTPLKSPYTSRERQIVQAMTDLNR